MEWLSQCQLRSQEIEREHSNFYYTHTGDIYAEGRGGGGVLGIWPWVISPGRVN